MHSIKQHRSKTSNSICPIEQRQKCLQNALCIYQSAIVRLHKHSIWIAFRQHSTTKKKKKLSASLLCLVNCNQQCHVVIILILFPSSDFLQNKPKVYLLCTENNSLQLYSYKICLYLSNVHVHWCSNCMLSVAASATFGVVWAANIHLAATSTPTLELQIHI